MNFYYRLMTAILKLPAIYNGKVEASNFSKIRQDLSSLFFSLQVYEIRKNFVPVDFGYT